jgi:hypothetical protein
MRNKLAGVGLPKHERAARAQLLVRLMEAMTAVTERPVPEVATMVPNAAVPEAVPAEVKRPSMSAMIAEALADGKARRPKDIAKLVRKVHGDGVRPVAVASVAWKMANDGKLAKNGHRYRLNGHHA